MLILVVQYLDDRASLKSSLPALSFF